MGSNINDNRIYKIQSLIHDPAFVEFELEQEAPTIFNAVGRTHTETWHSALLGWLLDPEGSHGLGIYPLSRFLLLLQLQDTLHLETRGIEFGGLLATGNFSKVRVRPNERELSEVSVVGVGRFDLFVDGIDYPPWSEVQLLIEIKVRAKIDMSQCQKYISYITDKRAEGSLIIPAFVAPTNQLIGKPVDVFGDASWIGVAYQDIYDEVIEPCLKHPSISQFGRFTLTEYTKTLKYRLKGGEPLAVTQKEREMVSAMMEKHEPAIRALFEILSEENEEFEPVAGAGSAPRGNIKVNINGQAFEEPSVRKLYRQVLKFLVDNDHLKDLELPVATGSKRYLLATEPQHQRGNEFSEPVDYEGYYMEAHKNRAGALRDLSNLLQLCNLSLEVKS
jgi:hypothetical protein